LDRMDTVFSNLPINYQSGLVGYYNNDSTLFVFKATDYLELAEFDSIPRILGDSSDLIAYYSLIRTLDSATKSGYTVVPVVMYRDAQLFPNSIVLMELFLQHKAFLFSIKKGPIQSVEYKIKKSNGVFRILGRDDSLIYYDIVYKNIERN